MPRTPRPNSLAGLGLGLALAGFLLSPLPAFAADGPEREQGVRLATEGRCHAAIAVLEKVSATDPKDALASLVAGQCWIRLQRYPEAVEALKKARALSPDLDDVDVSLAVAFYHLEDLREARAALARAEARNPNRASVQLYRGLILLADAETQRGVDALERARQLDRGYAEPVSSFYQGLAYAEIDEDDRAREALVRVTTEWASTAWAEEATRALERLDAASQQSRWWLQGSVGAEYDTNVLLLGSGVERPDGVSDEKDWRGVFSASGGATLLEKNGWALGITGSYYGTKEDEVSEFDTHYPTVGAWLDRSLGPSTVSRFQYRFGFAWVDDDAFLAEHTWQASVFQDWDERGQSQVLLRYVRNDFRFDNEDVLDASDPAGTCYFADPADAVPCGPHGLDEKTQRNRDGWEIATGVQHVLPLPDAPGLASPLIRGGYEFSWYDANGSEYSSQQHAFTLGAGVTAPWEIEVSAEATYAYRPYRHRSTYPDGPVFDGVTYRLAGHDREENEWQVGASLGRALGEYLSLVLSWRYTDNHSNVRVFDYDRHVVGLHLTGSLGQ